MILGSHATIWLAFIAGVLSFLSPCCLPLYPSYISYISGVTYGRGDVPTMSHRLRAMVHTMFFVLGFSVIFFALGLSATLIGQVFVEYRGLMRVVGGTIIFVMGLHLSGLITLRWLGKESKWKFSSDKTSYVGSVLVGVSFAAGWSPCIGPILASVLVLTATQSAHGIPLTLAYVFGFAIPFFVLGFTLASTRKLAMYGNALSKVAGYIMMVLGVMLFTNSMSKIIEWLIKLYGGFSGF